MPAKVEPTSLLPGLSPAAGEVTLRLDEESDPVKLVYENGCWTLATDAGPS